MDYMRLIKPDECPICHYKFKECQCMYSGDAHPDRQKNLKVVLEHLYMLNHEQLFHVIGLLAKMQISYSDKNEGAILSQIDESKRKYSSYDDDLVALYDKVITRMKKQGIWTDDLFETIAYLEDEIERYRDKIKYYEDSFKKPTLLEPLPSFTQIEGIKNDVLSLAIDKITGAGYSVSINLYPPDKG